MKCGTIGTTPGGGCHNVSTEGDMLFTSPVLLVLCSNTIYPVPDLCTAGSVLWYPVS